MLAPDWSKTLCVIHLVFNMSAPMICRFHQGDQEIRTEIPIQNYPDLLPLQIDVGLVGLDFYPNNVVPWCSSARTMATLIAVFFASIYYVQCALIVFVASIHTHTLNLLWMVAYCHDSFEECVFVNPLLCVPAIILHYWLRLLAVKC